MSKSAFSAKVFAVFVIFTIFVVVGLASPMLVLFGVADLLGGIWTWFALKADAQSDGIIDCAP